jgi:hypothetical protein
MHLCNIPIDLDNTINKGDGCIVLLEFGPCGPFSKF